MSNLQVSNINGVGYSPYSHRNKLINGGFDVWQRGTSFVGITTQYTADRWRCAVGATGAYDVEQSQMAYVDGRILNTAKFTVVDSTKFLVVQQRIENPRTLFSGKTYTYSGVVRVTTSLSAPKSVTYEVRFIKSDGTSLDGTSGALSTSASSVYADDNKFSLTVDIPTIDPADTFYMVEIRFQSGVATGLSNTDTISIGELQLEEGSVATPSENRPIGVELALCQRYYEEVRVLDYHPAYSYTGWDVTSVFFKVEKRVAPTITTYDSLGASGKISCYTSTAAAQTHGITSAFVITPDGKSATVGKSTGATSYGVRGTMAIDAEL